MGSTTNLSQVIFKLSSGDIAGEINLKPEAWRVLAQINGVRTLAEIAQNLGMDEATVINIADALFKARILDVAPGSAPPPSATVDGTFFDGLTKELARMVGPLASIIVEDEIAALGENRDDFPRDKLADLVERVSEAIKDNTKRVAFQRLMLEAIRKL
jgi:predicted transcriptional regulator